MFKICGNSFNIKAIKESRKEEISYNREPKPLMENINHFKREGTKGFSICISKTIMSSSGSLKKKCLSASSGFINHFAKLKNDRRKKKEEKQKV